MRVDRKLMRWSENKRKRVATALRSDELVILTYSIIIQLRPPFLLIALLRCMSGSTIRSVCQRQCILIAYLSLQDQGN